MANTQFSLEITYNKKQYFVNADVEFSLEDQSFDHEFGTQEEYGISVDDYDYQVLVKNKNGDLIEVTGSKIEEKLDEKIIDMIFDKIYSLDLSEFFGSTEREED
jgi:hypothetical protein